MHSEPAVPESAVGDVEAFMATMDLRSDDADEARIAPAGVALTAAAADRLGVVPDKVCPRIDQIRDPLSPGSRDSAQHIDLGLRLRLCRDSGSGGRGWTRDGRHEHG
jgi:hypothetical protein